jgi:hypothetical protein
VHLVGPEHGENVTVVSCGDALGQMKSKMILFKAKRCNPEWRDDLPPGTAVEMTEIGSMTTETFIKRLEHFSKYKPPGKVLLIFDGATSHLDANTVIAAGAYDVTLFCFPSNTTHELQPMDKAVFKSFEIFWGQEIMLFWNGRSVNDRLINKVRFGKIFSKVWKRLVTPANLISGFRATLIFPLDPHIIPEEAFAPSSLTQENHVTDEIVNPARLLPEVTIPDTAPLQGCPLSSDESSEVQNDISEQFETNKGFWQGDAQACFLLSVVLEKVMRDAGILNSGTIYNKSTQVLAYADDINIIGHYLLDTIEVFTKLERYAKEFGLQVNECKTKCMVVSTSEARRNRIGQNLTIGE